MKHVLMVVMVVLVALVVPLAGIGCAALGPVVPGVAVGVWAGWELRGIVDDERPAPQSVAPATGAYRQIREGKSVPSHLCPAPTRDVKVDEALQKLTNEGGNLLPPEFVGKCRSDRHDAVDETQQKLTVHIEDVEAIAHGDAASGPLKYPLDLSAVLRHDSPLTAMPGTAFVLKIS